MDELNSRVEAATSCEGRCSHFLYTRAIAPTFTQYIQPNCQYVQYAPQPKCNRSKYETQPNYQVLNIVLARHERPAYVLPTIYVLASPLITQEPYK